MALSVSQLLLISVTCCSCFLYASEFPWQAENKFMVHVDWPGPTEDEVSGEVLFMTSADREKYKCILPQPKENSEKDEMPDEYKGQTPLELLKPIFSQLICPLKIGSFWVYELCHGYYLRQFHEEKTATGKLQLEYILGKFDMEAALAEEKEKAEKGEQVPVNPPTTHIEGVQVAYYAVNMTDGSFCELSGQKRFTRVLYVCHQKGSNGIYSLKETSSCEYEVIVLTSLLCKHPAFRKKYVTETAVYCHPLNGSPSKPRRLVKFLEDAVRPESFKPSVGTSALEEELKRVTKQLKEMPEVKDDKAKGEQDELKHVPNDDVHDDSHADAHGDAHADATQTASVKASEKKASYPHDEKHVDDVLHGQFCLTGGSGWWRFEFCYGKHVNQYHIDDAGKKTSILLGVWNREKHRDWLNEHPSKKPKQGNVRQVSHLYSDGDFCDEAKKRRKVEVRLRCKEYHGHPDAMALYFSEPRTCEYTLTVESPVFCSSFKDIDEYGLTPELQ